VAIGWKLHRGLGAPLGCPYKARVPVKVAGGPYGIPARAGFDPEPARHASEALRVRLAGLTLMAPICVKWSPVPALVDGAPVLAVVKQTALAVRRGHWQGTSDGFAALCRLAGLQTQAA